MLLLLDFFGKNVALGGFFCCSPYYLHEEMLLWDSSPHRKVVVQNLCSSFSVSYQLIGDKWTHKWNSFFVCYSIAPIVTKSLHKSPLQDHHNVWKRTRISLAQKLDIIEALKKSGFSIEDVMKKYGFFSLEKTDLVNLCGFFHALSVRFLNQNYCHILNI